MRYIGLDLGNRTCGLAISDPLGMIATSLYTIRFFEKDLNCALTEVVKVINEKKLEVILFDERLTTVEVQKVMISADVSRNKRKKVVDTLAATLILQSYLDSIR